MKHLCVEKSLGGKQSIAASVLLFEHADNA